VRQFALFTGHTVLATSSVLAAFMGGLALGAWPAGLLADRSSLRRLLRLYGAVELGIGACGLLTLPLISLAGRLVLTEGFLSAPAAFQSAAYFAAACAILIVPACLMGATLPLLTRWWSARDRLGDRGNSRGSAASEGWGAADRGDSRGSAASEGWGAADRPLSLLYGLNTLGAVAGAALAGFALIPWIGISRTLAVAASLNALCAALAWAASAFERDEKPQAPAAVHEHPPAAGQKRAMTILALTGAAAMICEVAWTREFALVLGSTVYAFTVMLATFLLGLAAGSLAFHRLRVKSATPFGWTGLGLLLSAAALCVYAGLPFFGRLPYLLLKLQGLAAVGPGAFTAVQCLLCACVTAAPTLLMGAVFPWAAAAAAPDSASIGRATGACYTANTLGAIVGSAAAGLALLPLLGVESSLLAAVWIYGGAALLAFDAAPLAPRLAAARRWLPAAALAGLGLLSAVLSDWDPRLMAAGVFIYAPAYASIGSYADFVRRLREDELIFHENGANASVTVLRTDIGTSYMRINGKTDASEGQDMATQWLLGYLPLAAHPASPRRALVVGLGIGVTASALASEPGIDRIDVAEIEPAVARGARFFESANRGVLRDPRIRLRFADARQVLAAPGEPYDIITSEPSNPWIAGIASLYTREAFEAARGRLAPDGVFCQWFHGYFMSEQDFRMVVKTFVSVFPNAMLMSFGQADYFLMGSNTPWRVDYGKVRRMFEKNEGFRQDMLRLRCGLDHPLTFLAWPFVDGDSDLRSYAGDGPVHTDDRPTLEFSAPRSFQVRKAVAIHESLASAKTTMLPDGLFGAPAPARAMALIHDLSAQKFLADGDQGRAEKHIKEALSLDPGCGRAWVRWGNLRELQGRPAEALSSYLKGLKLEPSYVEGKTLLGRWFAEHRQMDNALRELEGALALAPGYPAAAVEAGLIYLVRNRTEDARRVASSALAVPIMDVELRKKLLYILEKSS